MEHRSHLLRHLGTCSKCTARRSRMWLLSCLRKKSPYVRCRGVAVRNVGNEKWSRLLCIHHRRGVHSSRVNLKDWHANHYDFEPLLLHAQHGDASVDARGRRCLCQVRVPQLAGPVGLATTRPIGAPSGTRTVGTLPRASALQL